MKGKKIILASQSPRRQELLKAAGYDFEIVMADVKEDYPVNMPVGEIPEYLALKKGRAVKQRVGEYDVIIAADTIVVLDRQIYEKPKDEEHARRMLRELSGKMHEVITGVCLITPDDQSCFSVSTKVYFNKLTDDEISYYVSRHEPFDKAGSYAIQEWIGMIGIEKIEGCYFNVVGLPVSRLYHELNKIL